MSDSTFASSIRLFEILHSLPEIMKEGDSIKPSMSAEEDTASSIGQRLAAFTQKCREFETSLKEWYGELEWRYQTTHRHSQPWTELPSRDSQTGDTAKSKVQLYWFEPSTLYSLLEPDSLARIFPLFICFVNPDVAFQVVEHWTGLLLMYSTLHMAQTRLRSHEDNQSPPQINNSTFTSNPRTLALLIAQSLEYFVHPDMGLLGTNIIGFPLSVAQGYFQHTGAVEVLWFDVIFERITALRSGLRGFLDDMAKGNTVKLVRPWNRSP
ncbi:hypothetical protein H2200_007729 [Cladophialophora chaetospira]|uniref:Uncharacterized protein n=1 Tax=Cladophialophora chaetospira TaxID=386627 RepID=A0AA38X6R2_9EURO|nr:hypothetical protein H2200_007729 [Cladophialophora chaetospira]